MDDPGRQAVILLSVVTGPPEIAIDGPERAEGEDLVFRVACFAETSSRHYRLTDAAGDVHVVGGQEVGPGVEHVLVPGHALAKGPAVFEVDLLDAVGNAAHAAREIQIVVEDPFSLEAEPEPTYAVEATINPVYAVEADMGKSWLIGSTVEIVLRVKDPATRSLVDPASVTLLSLKRGTTSLPTVGITVSHVSTGVYRIPVPTTGYQPGTHHWLVAVAHADGRKAVVEGTFVMAAPV